MSALDWEAARQRERRRQRPEKLPVLGSRQRIAPVHKHTWTDWESPTGTQATVERSCMTCGRTERRKLVLSDIAQTPQERARVRGQARFRRGYALNPQGQQNSQYKQRRQNVQD